MKNISVQSKGVTTYTPPTRSFKVSRYAALGLCMGILLPISSNLYAAQPANVLSGLSIEQTGKITVKGKVTDASGEPIMVQPFWKKAQPTELPPIWMVCSL